MDKITIATLATCLIASIVAAETSLTTDFASAYVFRGATMNDGFVVQPGIAVSGLGLPEKYGMVLFGVWGNYSINDYGGSDGSNFSEIDWYGSYYLPTLVKGLNLSLGYTEFTYGAGSVVAGTSEAEVNLEAAYEIAGASIGIRYNQGVGGAIGTSAYTELTLGYGISFTTNFSGSVTAHLGYAVPNEGSSGFQNYDIGAGLNYMLNEMWGINASLTYIGQGDDDVLPDGIGLYDVDVVGKIGLSCTM
jgi:hypothetical protein